MVQEFIYSRMFVRSELVTGYLSTFSIGEFPWSRKLNISLRLSSHLIVTKRSDPTYDSDFDATVTIYPDLAA